MSGLDGRPPLALSPAQLAEVETLAGLLTVEQIADYFGMGRTTFFRLMSRDAGVAERYKRGKARAIGAIAQGLITKARNGDTTSMIFYLKTQAGWRETAGLVHALEPAEAKAPEAHRILAAYLDRIAERQRASDMPDAVRIAGPDVAQ